MADGRPQITSAPASRKLTKEEREARFATLRAKLSTSRLKVAGRSDRAYYWARKNDTGELARLQYLGWEVVHDNPKDPQIKASGLLPDGTYVMGDVILLQMDAESEAFLKEENIIRAELLVSGATEQFISDAGAKGVPTFERQEDPSKITAKHLPVT